MNIQEFYTMIGADSGSVIRRFSSEALVRKYLGRFLSDGTYAQLSSAMEAGDAETAFRAAHTLKGLALNLELPPLTAASSELTELLRNKQDISSAARDAFRTLTALYDDIIRQIARIE